MTALARKAGIGVETVRKLVYGMGGSDPKTITAVAGALGRDVRTVAGWASERRAMSEPFEMPAEADLLTDRERRAVVELVRAITADRRVGGSRGNTAPIAADYGEFQPALPPHVGAAMDWESAIREVQQSSDLSDEDKLTTTNAIARMRDRALSPDRESVSGEASTS